MLIVDLDNTLVKTDILYEMFFSLLTHKPLLAIKTLLSLMQGKAKLKQTIAQHGKFVPEDLPYRQEVIDIINQYKQNNHKIALVSGSDQSIVTSIANYLGIFDYAYGSDGIVNLSGKNKIDYIKNKFPNEKFAYIGDSVDDIPVWEKADKIITATKNKTLQNTLNNLSITKPEQTVHIYSGFTGISPYILTLRPHQWIKNILVFIPMLSERVYSIEIFLLLFLCFILFSLTASSVYILNDIIDLKSDRLHASKKNRPITCGDLKINEGLNILFLLLGIVFLASIIFLPLSFLAVIIIYFLLTVLYSLVLKRRLVIDICALSILYTLRIIAGDAATGIVCSQWVLVFSGYIFLSLAAMKRQTELVNGLNIGRLRSLGRAYSIKDTPIITMIALASGYISVLVLALYIHSKQEGIIVSKANNILLFICPIVIYWITRLIFIAHAGKMNDDPIVYTLKDKTSIICGVLVFIIFFLSTSVYG